MRGIKEGKMTATNLVGALGKTDSPRIVMSCKLLQRKIEYFQSSKQPNSSEETQYLVSHISCKM